MAIPAVLHVASMSQALPVGAVLARRGRLRPAPVVWVAAWCVVLLLSDAGLLLIARWEGNNLWVRYIALPAESTLALWTLSYWQVHDLLRLAYRLAIPLLLVATALTLAFSDSSRHFDEFMAPLHALVLLTAALHTLVHRAIRTEGSITRESWFWVSLGMSLYFGSAVALQPFNSALLATHMDWVRAAYLTHAWVEIVAFALITVGVLCPPYQGPFGGRS